MRSKSNRQKTFKKILFLILIITLLIAMPPDTVYASGPTDFSVTGRVADPDTSNNMNFSDKPGEHDGRIWTDKSVNIGSGDDDFEITLSALSQSFPVTEGYAIPADTVFIIDVSGSMYQEKIGGVPRISVLVDALNEAIDILLKADPRNRVAVVAYGGLTGGISRAENVLPLDRPVLEAGAKSFFTHRQVGTTTEHYVDVHTTNKFKNSVLVQGSTPTQKGILYGANVLTSTSADDLTIPALDAAGGQVFEDDGVTPLMITRKPNIILMTDGEPTMGWDDYLFENTVLSDTDTSQKYGDGSNGEMGVSLLTVLTAAHRKQLVYNYYFSGNNAHNARVGNYNSEAVGFYTISLGAQGQAQALINATMFPFVPGSTEAGYADDVFPNSVGGPLTPGPNPDEGKSPNMGELLKVFAAPAASPISFQALRRGSPTWSVGARWERVTINNSRNLTIDDLAFADQFFPANDLQALRNAFLSITTDIQRQSHESVTSAPAGYEHFDGYLVFSDVLGEYMEFRGITGFEFDGASFSRDGFGPAVINNTGGARARYEAILLNHMNYDIQSGSVSAGTVTALIQSNIASGHLAENNSIKYFASSDIDFRGSFFNADGTEAAPPPGAAAVVELFPMWGNLSEPVIPHAQTDLMYVEFQVITALEDNTVFEELFQRDNAGGPLERTMNKDDQMIRWYIPASFIPQRWVDHDTGVISGNRLPVRVNYIAGLDQDRVALGISSEYKVHNRAPDELNDLYFYSNRSPQNVTLAFYRPHKDNPYYMSGNNGRVDRAEMKESNPTETVPHVTWDRYSSDQDGSMDLHWLGNDGRLTVTFDPPEEPGSLMITKEFEGLPIDINIFDFVSEITFLIVGLDEDGEEIYREVVTLEPGTFRWNDEKSRYELVLTDLPLGDYRVYERGGHAEGFIMDRPGPPELVSITDPGQHVKVNFVNKYTPIPPVELPALTVIKVFHGLANADKPADFEIRITGPDGFEAILALDDCLEGRTLTGLTPGPYTIEEINYDVPGFDLTQITIDGRPEDLPYTFTLDDMGAHIKITIDNYYTPVQEPPGSLTITKAFEGLPSGTDIFNFVSPITFLVIGRDAEGNEGNVIYRDEVALTARDFVWNPTQRRYELTLDDLPLGYYRVYERGGSAAGFVMQRPGPPELVSITVPGAHEFAHFVNKYTPIETEPMSFRVQKVFHGLADSELPSDFYFRITGPDEFDERIYLKDAIEGKTFVDVIPGEYTIIEYGSDVPGFDLLEVRPELPYTFTVGLFDAPEEPLTPEEEMTLDLEETLSTDEEMSETPPTDGDSGDEPQLGGSGEMPQPGGSDQGTDNAPVVNPSRPELLRPFPLMPIDPTLTPLGLTGDDTCVTIIIDNFYESTPPADPYASLTITKRFEGLPIDINILDLISPLTFLDIGEDAGHNEIHRATVGLDVGPFVWNHVEQRYEYTMTELPLGDYRVYERGGYAEGFLLNSPDRPGPPEIASITVPYAHEYVHFVNRYEPFSTVNDDTVTMTVRKIFHGLANVEKPEDFELHITGPRGFDEEVFLQEALVGHNFYNIVPGSYVLEEINYTLPEFDFRGVTVNGQVVTLPYTFEITGENRNVEIRVDDYYTPIETPPNGPPPVWPPPPGPHPPTDPYDPPTDPYDPPTDPYDPPTDPYDPPTDPPTDPYDPPTYPPDPNVPQTGAEPDTARYIILILAGILLMGFAVLYGRRKKIFS